MLRKTIFFLIVSILTYGTAFCKTSKNLPKGEVAIDALENDIRYIIKNTRLKMKDLAIEVYSLWKDEYILAINKDKMLTPASNLKIITSSAALFYLKPEYSFKTEISTDGKLKGEHLYGNLYIKGYGDPSLTREEIWKIVQTLKGKGIKFIHGDIVGDDTYFDSQVFPARWGGKKRAMKYGGEISALSANFNTIIVNFESGDKVGAKPRIWLEPETSFVSLVNKSVTRKRSKRYTLNISGINNGKIVAKGGVPFRLKHKTSLRKVTDAPLFTVTLFYDLMKKMGIEVLGSPRKGLAHCENKLILKHSSKPLSYILAGMNKFSNNFTAEQILKTLGAEVKGAPGTFEKGIEVLNNFIESIGGDSAKIRVFDGSGLSKDDLISADNIVKVLKYMHNSPIYAPEFISSLPVAGIDGTTEKRLMFGLTKRKIRAKTGTINNVSSLSGFLYSKDGEPMAFSMIMNGFRVSEESVQLIQDKICYILSNFSRFDNSPNQ